MPSLTPIPEAIEALKKGRMIVLVDDEDRENEGDLVVAAELVTPQIIAFMAKKASGLICLPLAGSIADQLQLPPQTRDNRARFGTNFTVSIEAAQGVSTGISAADRAQTVRVAVNPTATPEDLVQPGHIFPIRARAGGVLVRAGQTEGSVDLCRLAGLRQAAVICEVMKDDGTMARMPDLEIFCREHDLPLVSIADLIEYRRRSEKLVERVEKVVLPTHYGDFDLHLYRNLVDDSEHAVFTLGILTEDLPPPSPASRGERTARGTTKEPGLAGPELPDPVLVRVHSQCLTGEVFGSLRCDCGPQLEHALDRISREGRGAVLYLMQEGRGIGLRGKLHAYRLQDAGLDTVDANLQLGYKADLREYGIGAQILADLGIRRLRLMTNNPHKYVSLQGYGLEIVSREPVVVPANAQNRRYLKTKRIRLGHHLPDPDLAGEELG